MPVKHFNSNKQSWNQLNNSSSFPALAAASLVAKSKPRSMGSSSKSVNYGFRVGRSERPIFRAGYKVSQSTSELLDRPRVNENRYPPISPSTKSQFSPESPSSSLRAKRKPPPPPQIAPEPDDIDQTVISPPRMVDETDEDEEDNDNDEISSGYSTDIPCYSIISSQNLQHPLHRHHHHRYYHHRHHRASEDEANTMKGHHHDQLSRFLGKGSQSASYNNRYSLQPKMLRTTLRTDKLDSKHKKKKKKSHSKEFDELKPWKHHKNSTSVSDNERQLYQTVWEENKNSYIPVSSEDRVSGLVVRELWKRSHLSDEVLAKIWELLIDHRNKDDQSSQSITSLSESEFIVGMWMIDQSLYGRKLPKVIGPEVWDSVCLRGGFDPCKIKRGRGRQMLRRVVEKSGLRR